MKRETKMICITDENTGLNFRVQNWKKVIKLAKERIETQKKMKIIEKYI